MKKSRQFQCLRCDHRFPVDHDPAKTVERACPRCGSNSVWPEPKEKKPKPRSEKDDAAR